MNPHPLSGLSSDEVNIARDVVVASYPDTIIYFREIYLSEPPKTQLRECLALEHSGRLSPTTPRPSRLALCQYDVIGKDKTGEYHESIVDIRLRRRAKDQIVDKRSHAALVVYADSYISSAMVAMLTDMTLVMNSIPSSSAAMPHPCTNKRWPTSIFQRASG